MDDRNGDYEKSSTDREELERLRQSEEHGKGVQQPPTPDSPPPDVFVPPGD